MRPHPFAQAPGHVPGSPGKELLPDLEPRELGPQRGQVLSGVGISSVGLIPLVTGLAPVLSACLLPSPAYRGERTTTARLSGPGELLYRTEGRLGTS